MHSTFVARANAINHTRLMEVAKRLASHFGLNANLAVLESLVYSNKNPEALKLRQSEAIIDLLNEIGRVVGVEGMEEPSVTSNDMETVPDAGDDVPVDEAVESTVETEVAEKEQPKAQDNAQLNEVQIDDPRPRPKNKGK